MAITWVNTSSNAAAIANNVSYPSGWAADDILLLFVESANTTIPVPSGFTELDCSPQTTSNLATRLTAFYRIAQSGDSGSVSVGGSMNHWQAAMTAYRGVDTTTPLDVTPVGGVHDTSNTSGATGTSLTTVTANALIVVAFSHSVDSVAFRFSSWANANLVGVAESFDISTAIGNGGGVGSCDGTKTTAGAVGSTTCAYTNSSVKAFMTVALRESGASPPSSGPGDSCGVLMC